MYGFGKRCKGCAYCAHSDKEKMKSRSKNQGTKEMEIRECDENEMECPRGTKRLNVTINCYAVYNSALDVPIEMDFEKAILYAKKHIDEIPLGVLEYVPNSDELDEENCSFD